MSSSEIKKMEVVDIADSYNKTGAGLTVTERYFTPYYFVNNLNSCENEYHCVLFHSNRICLITLASLHPILKENKKICKINFQISKKLDRLDNKVIGKSKKGAQFLSPTSVLCFVECADGTVYTIYSCVKGKLIEINEELINNYNLLSDKPLSSGYVAIILPNINDSVDIKKGLINDESYQNIVNKI